MQFVLLWLLVLCGNLKAVKKQTGNPNHISLQPHTFVFENIWGNIIWVSFNFQQRKILRVQKIPDHYFPPQNLSSKTSLCRCFLYKSRSMCYALLGKESSWDDLNFVSLKVARQGKHYCPLKEQISSLCSKCTLLYKPRKMSIWLSQNKECVTLYLEWSPQHFLKHQLNFKPPYLYLKYL